MESFAGTAEMTLFWHCIFPGDVSSKPQRLEIYAYSDCGGDNNGFRRVVLWLRDPEYPIPLYVQCVTPPMPTTSPFLRVSLPSLSLPGTKTVWCAQMCQHVSPCIGKGVQPTQAYNLSMWSTQNNTYGTHASWCTHTKRKVDKRAHKTRVTEHKMTLKLPHLLSLWNSFESICTCRSTFLIRFDFVTSNPGRWIVPSAMRRSEFHFTSHHAFIFTLKTTQICSSSICKLSIRAQPLIPICCTVIFIK